MFTYTYGIDLQTGASRVTRLWGWHWLGCFVLCLIFCIWLYTLIIGSYLQLRGGRNKEKHFEPYLYRFSFLFSWERERSEWHWFCPTRNMGYAYMLENVVWKDLERVSAFWAVLPFFITGNIFHSMETMLNANSLTGLDRSCVGSNR